MNSNPKHLHFLLNWIQKFSTLRLNIIPLQKLHFVRFVTKSAKSDKIFASYKCTSLQSAKWMDALAFAGCLVKRCVTSTCIFVKNADLFACIFPRSGVSRYYERWRITIHCSRGHYGPYKRYASEIYRKSILVYMLIHFASSMMGRWQCLTTVIPNVRFWIKHDPFVHNLLKFRRI